MMILAEVGLAIYSTSMHLFVSASRRLENGGDRIDLRPGCRPGRDRRQVEALDPVPPGARRPCLWRAEACCWRRQRQDAHPAAQGFAGRRHHRSARLQGDSTEGRIFPHAVRRIPGQGPGPALYLGNRAYEPGRDADVTPAALRKRRLTVSAEATPPARAALTSV